MGLLPGSLICFSSHLVRSYLSKQNHESGRLRADQKNFLGRMRSMGYAAGVVDRTRERWDWLNPQEIDRTKKCMTPEHIEIYAMHNDELPTGLNLPEQLLFMAFRCLHQSVRADYPGAGSQRENQITWPVRYINAAGPDLSGHLQNAGWAGRGGEGHDRVELPDLQTGDCNYWREENIKKSAHFWTAWKLYYRADGNWSLLPFLLSVLPRVGFPILGNGFIDETAELLSEFESDDLFLSCLSLSMNLSPLGD